MDKDTRALVIKLCTQVGMKMEDVSAPTIMCGGLSDNQLCGLVAEITAAAEFIRAIATAAGALTEIRKADQPR